MDKKYNPGLCTHHRASENSPAATKKAENVALTHPYWQPWSVSLAGAMLPPRSGTDLPVWGQPSHQLELCLPSSIIIFLFLSEYFRLFFVLSFILFFFCQVSRSLCLIPTKPVLYH